MPFSRDYTTQTLIEETRCNDSVPYLKKTTCMNRHLDLYGQVGNFNEVVMTVYGSAQARYACIECRALGYKLMPVPSVVEEDVKVWNIGYFQTTGEARKLPSPALNTGIHAGVMTVDQN